MLTWKSKVSPTTAQAVLIISDQADAPLNLESSFIEKGFTTIHERHENALKTCRIVDPALVIIDTYLSHRKRLELCADLRLIASGPILLLMSDYNSSQIADIYAVGVDECLLRPISPAFLVVKALSCLLRKRWLEQDSNLPSVYSSL